MHFLEQMKKFIEWLQNAEEGKRMLIELHLGSKFIENIREDSTDRLDFFLLIESGKNVQK